MSSWLEDFSSCTLEEILIWQAANRAWSKELRTQNNSLVNRRLAKDITQDDYLANRKIGHDNAAECKRRANVLDTQISHLLDPALVRQV